MNSIYPLSVNLDTPTVQTVEPREEVAWRRVVDNLDHTRESFLYAVVKGAFTVPGDGSLDFGAVAKRLGSCGYEGWFVVEAEQDPAVNPPLRMAQLGYAEMVRVLTAAGYAIMS